MLERFTRDARHTVAGAVREAGELHETHVRPEHLLLGLLALPESLGAQVLGDLGLDLAGVRRRVVDTSSAVDRRGGLDEAERAALTDLGIDVDQVVARAEESFGPGALSPKRPPRLRRPLSQRRGPLAARKRRRLSERMLPWDGPRFAPESKAVLGRTLSQARDLRHNWIGTEHLLLALALERRGVAHDVLADAGVAYPALRARVVARLREAS